MFQWNPQGYFIPCYHLFAMLSLSWISTELVSGFILVTRSVTSNFLSKLWWNKQKNKCLNKHPCRTQVGSLQSTNALQMKLAPKPTLIIVASSKVLIQVEHDDWRFREKKVISHPIHHRSSSEPRANTIDPGTITHPLTCKLLSDLVYCS